MFRGRVSNFQAIMFLSKLSYDFPMQVGKNSFKWTMLFTPSSGLVNTCKNQVKKIKCNILVFYLNCFYFYDLS